MERLEIDTEKLEISIGKLNDLYEKADKQKNKKKPKSKADQGKTHTELDTACSTLVDGWTQFMILIKKTKEYMEELCKAYDESDKTSAKKITVELYDTVADKEFADYTKSHTEQINKLHRMRITDSEIRNIFDKEKEEGLNQRIKQFDEKYEIQSFGNPPEDYVVLRGTEAYSYNQHDYPEHTVSGCGVSCAAVCKSIVENKTITPVDVDKNSYANWPNYGFTNQGEIGNRFKLAYDEIRSGYPCVMNVKPNDGPNHYVAVTGVRSDADPNNLSWSDFVIVEVGDGNVYKASEDTLIHPASDSGLIITMNH